MANVKPSTIFHRGTAWHTYQNLERDFIDVTRYVALEEKNGGTYSERITQLLLLIGSTVDSIFFEMRTSSSLDAKQGVGELRQASAPKVAQYRDVYEPIYQLSTVRVLAHHGLTDYGPIKPFGPFSSNQSPSWWSAYNDVKHQFYQNWRKGTLDNLVNALGALFTLNILHKEAQYYLLRKNVIHAFWGAEDGWYDLSPDNVWGVLQQSFVGVPDDIPWGAFATSEVFTHHFRRDKSVTSEPSEIR